MKITCLQELTRRYITGIKFKNSISRRYLSSFVNKIEAGKKRKREIRDVRILLDMLPFK